MPSLRSHLWRQMLRAMRNWDLPIPELRQKAEKAAARLKPPRDVAVEPVQLGGLPAEWLTPTHHAPDRALLYLHGGGYVTGSIATHRPLVARIARASGARALLIGYRLAPEHPFPAALEDSLEAWHWLLGQGYAPGHLALVGDSAGGGLAIATGLALREAGNPLPGRIACLSPWTDLTHSGASVESKAEADPVLTPATLELGRHYAGTQPLDHPLVSPLFADLGGLPPLLVQVGSDEILLDDATRLVERCHQAGGQARLSLWPEMWHVFQAFAPYLPEAGQALEELGEFLSRPAAG